jgi:chromosome segregation ATPase
VLERPVSESVALFGMDVNALQVYINRREVSESVKNALREVLARRRKIQEIQAQAANADAEIKSIEQDQERIRKNMATLDKQSALYKRYVTQLDEQETRIQNLRKEANRLRNEAAAAEKDLRAYLDMLDITG